MKGQKEAVVELVLRELSGFKQYQDIALIMLTKDQLELIKREVGEGIMAGTIEYSKPLDRDEVMAYARSCVMNHIKKGKELNGNQVYGQTQASVQLSATQKKLSSLNVDSLPEELKEYVKGLV